YYQNDNYNSKKNHFEGSNKSRTLTSESKQDIIVNHRKFSRYDYYETVDSLWNEILKNNERDLGFKSHGKKIYTLPNGHHVMDVFFRNPESSQAIKTRYVTNETGYHSIKTLVDSGYNGNDPYIERFFNDFTPDDSLQGISVFEKKVN